MENCGCGWLIFVPLKGHLANNADNIFQRIHVLPRHLLLVQILALVLSPDNKLMCLLIFYIFNTTLMTIRTCDYNVITHK